MIVSPPQPPPRTGSIEIRHLGKRYGHLQALDDVSLQIDSGQFVTVLGPSGCGKTTLLRAIAGFTIPDTGEILLSGVEIAGWPPYRRPTAMVFQSYALFPHLTVAENVAFGLKEHARTSGQRLTNAELGQRVDRALALVDLEGYGARRIGALSGGQQQRVALARALVLEPDVLLLDEPLGALDVLLRRQMQGMLKAIQRRTGITFLAVTHDQEEALTMSDRIVVMNAGRIEQDDTPEAVFQRPRSRFVAEFMGDGRRNLFPAVASGDGMLVGGISRSLPFEGRLLRSDERWWVMLQPGALHLAPVHCADGTIPRHARRWETMVREVTYRGATISVAIAMPDGTRAIADRDAAAEAVRVGDPIIAWFDPDDLVLVPDVAPIDRVTEKEVSGT